MGDLVWSFLIFLELRYILPIGDFMKGEGNQCAFEGVDATVTQLKSYFLRIMFEWSCVLGHSEMHSIVNFIDSLSLRL